MEKDLHKRLEEAAKEYADKKFPKHRASENDRRAREDYQLCRNSCVAGAEHGYKEAIAQAKEWLEEHFFYKHHLAEYYWESKCDDMEEALADFEADMNKHLEDEK